MHTCSKCNIKLNVNDIVYPITYGHIADGTDNNHGEKGDITIDMKFGEYWKVVLSEECFEDLKLNETF